MIFILMLIPQNREKLAKMLFFVGPRGPGGPRDLFFAGPQGLGPLGRAATAEVQQQRTRREAAHRAVSDGPARVKGLRPVACGTSASSRISWEAQQKTCV